MVYPASTPPYRHQRFLAIRSRIMVASFFSTEAPNHSILVICSKRCILILTNRNYYALLFVHGLALLIVNERMNSVVPSLLTSITGLDS